MNGASVAGACGETVDECARRARRDVWIWTPRTSRAALRVAHRDVMLDTPYADELAATAKALSAPGKGVLAADESTGTIGKRLASIGCENTLELRVALRSLLFTAPGMEEYISGVIMYDETLRGTALSGKTFVQELASRGALAGIKVDAGVVALPASPDETTTCGLDGLDARCKEYYALGARFAKWRGVLTINTAKGYPSALATTENANALARYASICQQNGLVPIVEPEILMDGEHDVETCRAVTVRVLDAVFAALRLHGVRLDGMILKPNMVTPGSDRKGDDDDGIDARVAIETVKALRDVVPPSVPGILFLSGGQTEDEATERLRVMVEFAGGDRAPWTLSYSYGRALQASCLKTWQGKDANVAVAQQAFIARAKANSLASLGRK